MRCRCCRLPVVEQRLACLIWGCPRLRCHFARMMFCNRRRFMQHLRLGQHGNLTPNDQLQTHQTPSCHIVSHRIEFEKAAGIASRVHGCGTLTRQPSSPVQGQSFSNRHRQSCQMSGWTNAPTLIVDGAFIFASTSPLDYPTNSVCETQVLALLSISSTLERRAPDSKPSQRHWK